MPTPRLSLPYIVQSQAQKEVTHAEALNVLDALVQAAVETRALSAPPPNPIEGALYLVGVNPTGAWSDRGNTLAQWIGGAWAFRGVAEGFRLWLKDEDTLIVWTGTAWTTYPYASASEIFTRTASFAVAPTIAGALYRCDAAATPIIASLPLLANVPVGFEAKFSRDDASANAVTVMPAHNLLVYSEAFDDAAWVKAKLSVQENAGYAPDNFLDADRLIEDLTSGNHEIRQDFTKVEGVTKLVAAIAARPAGRSQIYLMLDDGTATNRVQVRADLTTGVVGYTNAAGTLTLDASGAADLGNGWRLLWLAATLPSASGSYAHRTRLYDGAASSYLGDGASGVFLSRAQLCHGSAPIPYLETTTTAIQETIGGANSYALTSQTETVVLTAGAAEWTVTTGADPPAGSVTLGASSATNAGELAFGTSASHGMVTYVLAATTTDGSTVELTTDGANFITIPAGKMFCFEAFQTTWNRTDGAHQVCRFSGGVIKNSAGTVTLVKAPTVIASDGTENQVTFAADDVGARLAVTITGKAGKTIETRVMITGAFLGL